MPPNQRPQVPDQIAPEQLQVGDAFSRPATIMGPQSQLGQLGAALSSFSPALNQWFGITATRDQQQAELQANTLAQKNRTDWNTAIKDGTVPAGASPWLQHYYEQDWGRIQLQDNYSSLYESMKQDGTLMSSNDPKVLNGWLQQKQQDLMQGMNGNEQAGFTDEWAKYQPQLTHEFMSYRDQTRYDTALQTLDQSITRDVTGWMNIPADVRGTPQQLANTISGRLQDAKNNGNVQYTESNKVAGQALIRLMESTGNRDLRNVANAIPAGSGSLGDISAIKEGFNAADLRLLEKTYTLQSRGREIMKLNMTDQLHGDLAGLAAYVYANKSQVMQDPTGIAQFQQGAIKKYGGILGPDEVSKQIHDTVDAMTAPTIALRDDPQTMLGFQQRLHALNQIPLDAAGQREAQVDALQTDIYRARMGNQLSDQTYGKLLEAVSAKKDGTSIVNNEQAKDYWQRSVAPRVGWDLLNIGKMKPDAVNRGALAEYRFNTYLTTAAQQYSAKTGHDLRDYPQDFNNALKQSADLATEDANRAWPNALDDQGKTDVSKLPQARVSMLKFLQFLSTGGDPKAVSAFKSEQDQFTKDYGNDALNEVLNPPRTTK